MFVLEEYDSLLDALNVACQRLEAAEKVVAIGRRMAELEPEAMKGLDFTELRNLWAELVAALAAGDEKWVPHIVKDGSREHVTWWDSNGAHCSEAMCEKNRPALAAGEET